MNQNILLKVMLIIPFFFTACFASEHQNIFENKKTNLALNHNFQGTKQWSLFGTAQYDKNESYDKGSGSIKFSKTAKNWRGADQLISNYKIPVTPGKTYLFSFKTKTKIWSPPSLQVFGSFHNDKGMIANSGGSFCSNSKTDIWEENLVYIKVPKDKKITSFSIKIFMMPKHGKNGEIWIDDIKFRENLVFNNLPSKKDAFDGSLTRVDKLGNIEIYRNKKWQPFFPMCVYANDARKDWTIYSKQGFNCNMWASFPHTMQKAKDAGMYSAMQIVQYIVDVNWIPKDKTEKMNHFKNILKKIKEQNLMDNILFYYIDNEFYKTPENLLEVAKIIDTEDRDKDKKRMHPTYMLNGAFGLARQYNDLTDLTGTYVAFDRTDKEAINSLTVLDHIENQKQPAAIAQINRGIGLNFKPVLFGAIAKGAKGMGFWRDGGSANAIETKPWWNDLPVIKKEIDQMIPLIRQSHITSWSASCDKNEIAYGTRTLNDTGYMIITNPTYETVKAKFTISNLPYTTSNVKDYFTDKKVGSFEKNSITLILKPHDAKVIRLEK